MTSDAAALRFKHGTVTGIGASITVGVVVGIVYTAMHMPALVQGPVTAGMGRSARGSRADHGQPAMRPGCGCRAYPERRVASHDRLVVTVLAVCLNLTIMVCSLATLLVAHLFSAITNSLMVVPLLGLGIAGTCAIVFLTAEHFSHYLGKRPYLWTFVAYIAALSFMALMGVAGLVMHTTGQWVSVIGIYEYAVLMLLAFPAAWIGRRPHSVFLSKKLAQVERRAARAAATAPPRQNAVSTHTAASRETRQSPVLKGAAGFDAFEEIEELAHLRDVGALTPEEFQVKKTQILDQI